MRPGLTPLQVAAGRGRFILALCLFRLALDLSFARFVSPIFDYMGFDLDVVLPKYVESWALLFGVGLLAPHRATRPSDFFVTTLAVGFVVPVLAYYGLSNESRSFTYLILTAFVTISSLRGGPNPRVVAFREGRPLILAAAWMAVSLTSAWFLQASGGTVNLDFGAVYEVREQTGAALNVGPMGYVNKWATNVFGPLLLGVALWKRRFAIAAGVAALHVVWFGISAHKAVLFNPALVIGAWWLLRGSRGLSVMPLALSAIVGLSLLLTQALDLLIVGSMLIRRVFFVPAKNAFDYHAFFSVNDHVYWSNSILSSFLRYPYQSNPADLIGMWRGTESHVNNSFLATGYMHAGASGIVLYALLVALLFRSIDALSDRDVPIWLAVATLIVPSYALLINADFFTALTTHGVGIGVIALAFLRGGSPTRGGPGRSDAGMFAGRLL